MIPAPTTITSACTGPIFAEGPSSDTVAQDADALDLQLDDIARLQPAAVAMLEDAAGPDCPGAENVSRTEVGVPCRVPHDGVPRVIHVRQIPARALLTVYARDHRPARAVELIRGHEHRADARGEILSLRRAEPDFHLGPLQIARGPVVHDREPRDPGVSPDDRCYLELVVELVRIGRSRDLVLRTVDRCRIGEVEHRLLVPLRRNLLAAQRSRRLDVLLEHIEVAYRGRVQDGRTEGDLGERILRVPPGGSGYSACRRALPPPVKYDCNVCAASCTTVSPSTIPGQPRSSCRSRGVNMQSLNDPAGDVGGCLGREHQARQGRREGPGFPARA